MKSVRDHAVTNGIEQGGMHTKGERDSGAVLETVEKKKKKRSGENNVDAAVLEAVVPPSSQEVINGSINEKRKSKEKKKGKKDSDFPGRKSENACLEGLAEPAADATCGSQSAEVELKSSKNEKKKSRHTSGDDEECRGKDKEVDDEINLKRKDKKSGKSEASSNGNDAGSSKEEKPSKNKKKKSRHISNDDEECSQKDKRIDDGVSSKEERSSKNKKKKSRQISDDDEECNQKDKVVGDGVSSKEEKSSKNKKKKSRHTSNDDEECNLKDKGVNDGVSSKEEKSSKNKRKKSRQTSDDDDAECSQKDKQTDGKKLENASSSSSHWRDTQTENREKSDIRKGSKDSKDLEELGEGISVVAYSKEDDAKTSLEDMKGQKKSKKRKGLVSEVNECKPLDKDALPEPKRRRTDDVKEDKAKKHLAKVKESQISERTVDTDGDVSVPSKEAKSCKSNKKKSKHTPDDDEECSGKHGGGNEKKLKDINCSLLHERDTLMDTGERSEKRKKKKDSKDSKEFDGEKLGVASSKEDDMKTLYEDMKGGKGSKKRKGLEFEGKECKPSNEGALDEPKQERTYDSKEDKVNKHSAKVKASEISERAGSVESTGQDGNVNANDKGYDSAGQKNNSRNGSAEPTTAKAFQRIKVDEIVFADERLKDNSYWAKGGADCGYGAKAQEVLGQVRGRDFRHEKTKKKRGAYRGGQIDLQSHSVKFNYSDDE